MEKYITVRPAYGVKLNSQKAVREHFEADKDFEVMDVFYAGGRYVNKADAEKFGLKLEVRYGYQYTRSVIL